jgi:hypothetical protein
VDVDHDASLADTSHKDGVGLSVLANRHIETHSASIFQLNSGNVSTMYFVSGGIGNDNVFAIDHSVE